MGMYKYIRESWKNPDKLPFHKKRLDEWRDQQTTVRIERPTRLDKARSLGYRAKQGYVLLRQRVLRGGRQRPHIRAGRRTKHAGHRKTLAKNYQQIAEERSVENYKNCEVLNSYFVGKDGMFYYYEIILVDRDHPAIKKDSRINWICNKRGRAIRGLTSAGRRSR